MSTVDLIFSQKETQTDNQKIVPTLEGSRLSHLEMQIIVNAISGESNDMTLKTNIPTELIIKEAD